MMKMMNEEAAEDDDGPGKKTEFSAEDVKQFRAAAVVCGGELGPAVDVARWEWVQ